MVAYYFSFKTALVKGSPNVVSPNTSVLIYDVLDVNRVTPVTAYSDPGLTTIVNLVSDAYGIVPDFYTNNRPDVLWKSGAFKGQWATSQSRPGIQGPTGPEGPQGIQGVQGNPGLNGAGTNADVAAYIPATGPTRDALDARYQKSSTLDSATAANISAPGSATAVALSGIPIANHRTRHEYGGADQLALDRRQIVEPVRDWVRDKLALTPSTTFRIVFMGDSQTNDGALQQPAGQADIWGGGKGYSYRVANLLTKEGTKPAQAGTPGIATNTTAGAHVWSTAVAGATSGNYAPAGVITNIGTIAPELVFHAIGTNDFANQVPVATYKANVEAALNAVQGAAPNARQVLIMPWPRINPVAMTITWAQYAGALRAIADARKADTKFVLFDYGTQLERTGGATLTPWASMFPDGIHALPELHRELAEELAVWLGLPSPLAAFGTTRVLVGTLVANGVATAAAPASSLTIPAAPVPRTVTVKVRALATVSSETDFFVRLKDDAAVTSDYLFHVQTATMRNYAFEIQAEIPAHTSRVVTLYGGAGVSFLGGGGYGAYNQFFAEVSYI